MGGKSRKSKTSGRPQCQRPACACTDVLWFECAQSRRTTEKLGYRYFYRQRAGFFPADDRMHRHASTLMRFMLWRTIPMTISSSAHELVKRKICLQAKASRDGCQGQDKCCAAHASSCCTFCRRYLNALGLEVVDALTYQYVSWYQYLLLRSSARCKSCFLASSSSCKQACKQGSEQNQHECSMCDVQLGAMCNRTKELQSFSAWLRCLQAAHASSVLMHKPASLATDYQDVQSLSHAAGWQPAQHCPASNSHHLGWQTAQCPPAAPVQPRAASGPHHANAWPPPHQWAPPAWRGVIVGADREQRTRSKERVLSCVHKSII
eukprot:447481-Pelagomonas_calceolata.AAC.11